MTDIASPYTITRQNGQEDAKALRRAIEDLYGPLGSKDDPTFAALTELADRIEEQLPPAIEEPKEFGSIVRAGMDGLSDRVLWQLQPMNGWTSELGQFVASFEWLDNPEVLRIGVGDTERPDVAPKETDDYKLGVSDTTYDILTKLRVLRSEAITSERKNAYDVAIATVEAMQP